MHTLAINRRFLYAGLFLVALGGVVVVADLVTLDSSALANVLRLWPLAWIAIGAGIVLRRSRFAVVAGVLAAMIPGLVLGGFAVAAPRHGLDCGAGSGSADTRTQAGTFVGPSMVQIDSGCGSISIGTEQGPDWQLVSSGSGDRAPDVEFSNGQLQISSTGGGDWFGSGRDTWHLTLPTTPLEMVQLDVAAGRANLALPNADIGVLNLAGSGAEIVVDATSARIGELDGSLDFGRLAIQLPQQGIYSGSIRVGAGDLRLCVPYGLNVHVTFAGTPREVRVNGIRTDATEWTNDNGILAANRADLSVKVNFGSVSINPVLGGCK